MALPIYTGFDDLVAVVDYLKTKATGVSLKEAKTVVDPKVLDGRKLSAMQTWGFVSKDNERLNLTPMGRDFARADAAARTRMLWQVIASIPYYRTVMEWLYHSKVTSVTNVEVAARWHEHNKEEVGTTNETTLKDAAVTLLGLADSAGLGHFTIGRHGNPTRFEADMAVLAQFTEAAPPRESGTHEEPAPPFTGEVPADKEAPAPPPVPRQIFVGHGKSHEPVEALRKILTQFHIPFVIAQDEPHKGRPISKKVAELMQTCSSAIFVFTCDEQTTDAKGNAVWRPSDNIVYELGAATVLYDGKIVMFREEGVDFASDFSDFGHITFEKGKIEAKAMDLLKELVGFGLLKVTPA